MPLKIYLAGTTSATEYRTYCKRHCPKNIELLDPLHNTAKLLKDNNLKSISDIGPDVGNKIVKDDKSMIKRSDCIMAWFNYSTVGTTMEIHLAYTLGIPVYVINPRMLMCNDIWLRYHSTKFFSSITSCFDFIVKEHYCEN